MRENAIYLKLFPLWVELDCNNSHLLGKDSQSQPPQLSWFAATSEECASVSVPAVISASFSSNLTIQLETFGPVEFWWAPRSPQCLEELELSIFEELWYLEMKQVCVQRPEWLFAVNDLTSFLPPAAQHSVIYTSPKQHIHLDELLQITLYPLQTFWANTTC